MQDFSTPDFLDDIAPPQAMAIENARANALQILSAHGYQTVAPPLVDYIETLTANDDALNRETFKMTDSLSGRTLGIRADQTPQITRFDAARQTAEPRRYCYCGPTLLTQPPQPWQDRERMQLGAECFGVAAPYADWEVAALATTTLLALGIPDLKLDLGHAGMFYALAADASRALQKQLVAAISRRDNRALKPLSANLKNRRALRLLTQIYGDDNRLQTAEAEAELPRNLTDELLFLTRQLRRADCDVGVNLSDLGSYNYHTGVVFTLYSGEQMVARGGRYQPRESGGSNGRAAVGFSINLRALPLPAPAAAAPPIATPLVGDDPNWRKAVARLQQNRAPIRFYPPDATLSPPCLRRQNGKWTVVSA